MRLLMFSLLFAFAANLSGQNLSNKGKEFWVGYGHNNLFFDNAGAGLNTQRLVLYLAAEAAATVTISVNGTTFSRTYNIAANSVIQTIEIPKTGVNDARLQLEGLSTKGIHIVSNVPIVAYAHQYGSNSSGATMLMPVETYGYTYYSLNYTQVTNTAPSYSWFFVTASESNTVVEITPSVATQGGRPANIPFTVSLNKGEIYNVFGKSIDDINGNDVTGSKIKSVAGPDGKCHPIGVFSGSSRMSICGESADIMQQQIFPASAWGTTYLTYPTNSSSSASQRNTNFYRIAVRDPSTIVKKNGVVLTGLVNNFYYEYSSSSGDFIEADKPILIGQYVPSARRSCVSYSGDGDPEMFFLSPVEQAIKNASFYSTNNQNINSNYVAIIVPSAGFNSLTVDGSSTFNYSAPHTQNAKYRVVIKSLSSNQKHTINSDSAFTAITYGFGDVESYGYNAGTLINNLDIIPQITNTLSQTGRSTYTCPNSPFKFSIKMAYKPIQMVWKFSLVSKISTNSDTTLLNPVPQDSALSGSRKFYEYTLPGQYFFADTGTYNIPISITSPDIDNCDNILDILYSVRVNDGPKPDFSYTYSGCKADTVSFTGGGVLTGYNITRWYWQFDDLTKDSVPNPKKKFDIETAHPTSYRVIADNGCVGDTTKNVITYTPPVATFGITPSTICAGGQVTFTDTSSFGGTLQSWFWDFGNGQTVNSNNADPVTITYPVAGIYTIKHFVHSTGSCSSDTSIKTLTVNTLPQVSFTFQKGCLQDSTVQFINNTNSGSDVFTYQWNFGDPKASVSNPGTSTLENPVHKYSDYGTYPVTLTASGSPGCASALTLPYTVTGFAPAIVFNVQNETSLCSQTPVTLTYQNNVVPDSIYRIDIYWDTLNQPAVFETDNLPSFNKVYTHQYPIFTAPATKTVDIKLVVYSKGGCISEKSRTITLYPNPALLFPPLPGVCLGSGPISVAKATLTNAVSGSGVYSGPGTNNDGLFNPAIAGVGTHSIKYIFTSSTGCKDSASASITVFAKPSVSFTVNSAAQCLNGNSFAFTNSSSISSGLLSFQWTFGDGSASAETNPLHVYTSGGIYTVRLVVTTNNGCIDSSSATVTVHPKPAVSFLVNIANQCLSDNNYSFTNASSVSSGLLTYSWNFGDATTSAGANPSHTYSAGGAFTVKLISASDKGCKDSASRIINVYPQPKASFSINTLSQCLKGNVFTFNNTSAVSSGTIAYLWSFGDGVTSTSMNPSHSFAAAGSFTVKLTVSTTNGCKDSASQSVMVNPSPSAAFTVNTSEQCLDNNDFNFSNTSSVNGGTLSSLWNFGDGTSSNISNASHTYTNTGTYSVKLIVTSATGCKDSITHPVTINARPIPSFNITNTGQCAGNNNYTFNNTSTLSTGTISSLWNFGDGITSTAASPSHKYASAGIFTVKLIVSSGKSCIDSTSQTVIVSAVPLPAFTVNSNAQCFVANSFSFTNTSSVSSSGALQYQWLLGDGSTAATANVLHTYAAPGVFTVKLIATSPAGCKDSTIKTVTVHPKPVPSFSFPSSPNCINSNFTFTNTSVISSGTLAYNWNFGDNSISTAINPTHTYTTANTFIVKLVATSNNGCKDSISQNLSVFSKPATGFTVNATGQCVNNNKFVFTNTTAANAGAITYAWNFGDSTPSSTTANAAHIYASAGVYAAKLVATSANGCTDSISQTVTAYPVPAVSFTVNDSAQCIAANSFIFSNKSSISTGTLAYIWNLGDSTSSTLASVTHTYASVRSYQVKLIAASSFNCTDSISKTITVLQNPIAAFTVNTTSACLNVNNFVFTNSSVFPGTPAYAWQFGDGTVSNAANPVKKYTAQGAYPVTLTVTGNNGCKANTAQTTLTVYALPTVNAGADLVIFEGNSARLNPVTAGSALTYLWSPSRYLNSNTILNPVTSPLDDVLYRLTVTATGGCTSTDEIFVKVLKKITIPNVFSPNGDGVNDTWIIKYLNDYPGCIVEIFNRYGASVFKSIGYAQPWNGLFNGNPLPVGTYYYIIDPKNGKEKLAGSITILK